MGAEGEVEEHEEAEAVEEARIPVCMLVEVSTQRKAKKISCV